MNIDKLLKELAPYVEQYEKNKKEREDPGFNVFYLISDYYYRETFHGDILYALLSPEEKHGEGNLFIHLFIDMINKAKPLKDKSLVDTKYYDKVSVKREYGTNDGNDRGRIDLLIIGQNNHCIVIENKLNNAGDTNRQLPKYRKDLKDKGYIIDAFVYIPLDQNKEPNKTDWTKDEKSDINQKLVIIPAYKIGNINLIKHWLTPAKQKAHNKDAKFIIKQYIALLNNLTLDIMDNEYLINVLVGKENFDTTMAIIENTQAICNKIKDVFIETLRIQTTGFGSVMVEKRKIVVALNSDWHYVIDYYSPSNQYLRHVDYLGKKELPKDIEPIWQRFQYPPFGEDYFDESKGWCYWDRPETLKAMHDGTFINLIIGELKETIKRIEELQL